MGGQGLVEVAEGARGLEVCHSVACSSHHPLGGHEALHANWASGMDASRTDSNLCPQSKPIAIREACAGIVKNTSTVHS